LRIYGALAKLITLYWYSGIIVGCGVTGYSARTKLKSGICDKIEIVLTELGLVGFFDMNLNRWPLPSWNCGALQTFLALDLCRFELK
jgi:hypothetical protein